MSTPAYDERLLVPWWAWPVGLGLALLVAAEVHGGAGGARAVVPYVIALPLAVVVLLRMSRGRVRVADGVLHVPGARVPVGFVGGVEPVDGERLRRLSGRLADPLAHVATRSWLPAGVRLTLVDPEDDTPYWVVGSRHPALLAAALERERDEAGGAGGAG